MLFPVVLLLGLNGLLVGILQSYDRFGIAAISPLVWNVVIIVGVVVLRPHFHGSLGIYAYAVAILAATVVQLAMAGAALQQIDFRLGFAIDWHDPRVRQVFALMLPVTIGLGIVNLDPLINSAFGGLVESTGAARDPLRIPDLHAAAGCVQRRGLNRPVPDAQPPGGAARAGRDAEDARDGMRQINLLLIPAALLMVLATPSSDSSSSAGSSTPELDAPALDRALLVLVQPPVRRHQPAADADVLRAEAAVDPDRPRGPEHDGRRDRLASRSTSRSASGAS